MANIVAKSPLAVIDAKIASIKTRGIQLRKDCHECLVMIIDHYIEHGDFTRLPMLTDAIRSSLGASLSQAANQWVSQFVPSLKWDDDVRGFIHLKGVNKEIKDLEAYPLKARGDAPANTFTGNARELPFYELEREVKQTPFDLNAMIIQLVKRAKSEQDKAIEAGKEPTFSKDQLELLEKAIVKAPAEGERPISVTAGTKETTAPAEMIKEPKKAKEPKEGKIAA